MNDLDWEDCFIFGFVKFVDVDVDDNKELIIEFDDLFFDVKRQKNIYWVIV